MKKTSIWLSIIILLIGGIVLMMNFDKKDKDLAKDGVNNEEEINLDKLREKIVEKGGIVSKDNVNQPFNPGKQVNKNFSNLHLSLIEVSENGSKTIQFTVENVSDEVELLRFGTSQKYDYEIFNEEGEQIYHFSEGKSFLQVIEEIELQPGEKLSYDLVLPELEPGKYTLTASLVAEYYGAHKTMLQFQVNR